MPKFLAHRVRLARRLAGSENDLNDMFLHVFLFGTVCLNHKITIFVFDIRQTWTCI